MELKSLYKRLNEEIQENNNDKIHQVAEKILHLAPEDKEVQFILALSLIKSDKPQQASTYFSKKPSNKDKNLFFAYLYYLHKIGKNEECLQILESEADLKDKQIQLLKAQVQYSNKQYNESSQVYMNILSNSKNEEDFEDIFTNCLCVESQREFTGKDSNNELEQLQKILEKQKPSREALFNYGLLLSILGQKQQANQILSEFENLVKQSTEQSQLDKEDLIMAQIQKDYNQSEKIESDNDLLTQKVTEYEKLLEQDISDVNLHAVLNNNLVVLRTLNKHQHYGESIKLIEQSITNNWKQTEQQLLNFKINKLILVLSKNKLVECINIIKDLENKYSQESLLKYQRYITVKTSLLLKMERFEELNELQNQLQKLVEGSNDKTYRLSVFLIQSEICRQRNEKDKIIKLFDQLHEQDKSVFENQIICSFVFSILQNDQNLMQSAGSILKEIAQNTQNVEILEVLGDIYNKQNETMIAKGIYEKIVGKLPQSKKYKLKLASFYATQDPLRAQQLLEQFDDDFELLPQEQVEQLESEVALSKMNTNQNQSKTIEQIQKEQEEQLIQKKIQKKKKRKIRYPKNFDPENPGPKPDPERWLPKYERKEFRKKKGMPKKYTQGSSSAQNNTETKGTFQNNQTTAGQTVASGQGKSKNKRGKK